MRYAIKVTKAPDGLLTFSGPIETRDTIQPYVKGRESLFIFNSREEALQAIEKISALEAAGRLTPDQRRARIAELRNELIALGINLTNFGKACGWSTRILFRQGTRNSIYAMDLLAREMRGVIERVKEAGKGWQGGGYNNL